MMVFSQYILASTVIYVLASTEAFSPSHFLAKSKGMSHHFFDFHTSTCSTTSSSVLNLSDASSVSPPHEDASTQRSDENEAFQQRQMLKLSLLFQAQDAKRGFQATPSQRDEVSSIISQLAALNPTSQPAAAYYTDQNTNFNIDEQQQGTIRGKWTLQYTNAPDITSLDPTLSNDVNVDNGINLPSPPPLSKLGRIGQECDAVAGTITNVIEWRQPDFVDWFDKVNKSNDDSDYSKSESNDSQEDANSGPRVLQKIVCEATADPDRPYQVDLQLVAFELLGETEDRDDQQSSESKESGGSDSGRRGFNIFNPLGLPLPFSSFEALKDGPARLLKSNPIKLRGPLKAPFGKFEILYLDEDMRIIKTGQGYFAVNVRGEAWF